MSVVLPAVRQYCPNVTLKTLREIDPVLTGGTEDWQIILELAARGLDGLITCDKNMLTLPREMAVLHQTKFSVVVVEEGARDAISGLGALLLHLARIARAIDPKVSQVWSIAAPRLKAETGLTHLENIVRTTKAPKGTSDQMISKMAQDLLRKESLTPAQLKQRLIPTAPTLPFDQP